MSDAFISYRRKPSAPQASLLQEKLKNRHNIDVYLDTTRTDSTKVQFPDRLMGAIEEAPTFILMLGDTTLESEWVLKEIHRAYDLKKHCIPVFQESYTPTNSQDPAVNYVLNFDGVHLFDVKNIMIDESVANISRLVIRQKPMESEPMIESHVKITPKGGILLGVILMLLVIMAVIILAVLNGTNQPNISTTDPTHTPESVALVTDELSPTVSETATIQPTNTVTIESSPTPQPTQTDSPTNPTSLTLSPEQLALTPVVRNEDWTPYERNFDGLTMVLVPAGCFMMGNETGSDDEKPAHQQCFEEPFWIDKYEVTQAQFAQFGGQKADANYFMGDDLPVELITWFEARDYCEQKRGGRLPTEAEWEYAARGPNGLIYPWGNDFLADNVVYSGNSNNRTAPVGSRTGGVSWVGVMDMSGNVWEWTSDLYLPYLYTENNENIRNYVLRGGAFDSASIDVRPANRLDFPPSFQNSNWGFRCVRYLDD